MNDKSKIEELKLLIADYVTGQLNDNDKAVIEKALKESAELREFRADTERTFKFVNTVKLKEPSPQYWSSLLPRIHQRMEQQEAKKLSWDKISSIWKVLVPIAAIILIAIIYYLVKPSNTQITKEEKNIEKIVKDTTKDTTKDKNENKIEEKKIPENKQDERIIKEEKRKPEDSVKKDRKTNKVNDGNLAKEEIKVNDDNTQREPVKEDLAVIDMEETSVFSTGAGAGLDDETENELKNLNDNEQNSLLEELQNSNL